MKLVINGDVQEFSVLPEGGVLTVVDLLERLDLGNRRVAVECNRRIVPRATHGQHVLNDGDVIEVVQFVGGG